MEELFNLFNKCLEAINNGLKTGAFPETSRQYIQRLGRSIEETLKVLDIVTEENTIQTGISSSSRGAVYNLRRAFYATLSRLEKEKGIDRQKSIEVWKSFVGKLIDFINNKGISEAPMKIVMSFNIVSEDGIKYINIEKAEILFFELEGVEELSNQ